MPQTNGSDPTDVRSRRLPADHLSRYVQRTFRHTLRGYSAAEVDQHLRLVRGWFTLAGFDRLLAERHDEILGSAVREAEETVERARREAEATLEQARREAAAIVEEATRRGEATTIAAEQRLASLKTLASAILQEIDAHS
jgi:DivIVA domain-containing protein